MSSESTVVGHVDDQEHSEHHPGARTYVTVGLILLLLTVFEVSAIYIDFIRSVTPLLLVTLFGLMIIKFALVALFFMHLKYDNRLFAGLFTAPLMVAVFIVLVLMALFGAYHVFNFYITGGASGH